MPRSRLRQFLFVALGLLASSPAPAATPYTVDDMLSVESLGYVRFDPSGRMLVFEQLGAFDQQADFGRDYIQGQLRSRIHAVDLQSTDAPRPLFRQEQDAGYTIRGIAPDGRGLVFREVSDRGVRAGFAALSGGEATMLDASLGNGSGRDLPWSGRTVAFQALGDGEADLVAALHHEDRDALVSLWEARNRGDRATAGQIGSGRFADLPAPTGWLAFADAGTGQVRRIADGRFSTWFASGDGAVWAALREQRLALVPGQRIENGANGGGIERRLVIIPARADAAANGREVCEGCDVLPWSLNWSAARPLLAFVSRDPGREWAAARFRVYNHASGETQAIDLGALRPHVARAGLAVDIRSAWVGDRLAVLAAPAPTTGDADPRPDWYLVEGLALRNLTGAFEGVAPQLIGAGRAGLIVLHGGDAWLVAPDGSRRNLTESIDEPVRGWREPETYSYLPPANPQPIDVLALETRPSGAGAAPRLLLIDLAEGRVDSIAAHSADSQFVAVSPATRQAAVVDRADNMTVLSVFGPEGSVREVVQLNARLRDVVGGTPVRIDHQGPGGDARMSWLLLPPGHQPGTRVPTVVIVYPGATGRDTWTRGGLDEFDPLSDHILAARGYAVLRPSLPVRYEQVPRDPLAGLVEEVFAAVDAAVAQGYVDPDRLAVQGGSYGGYTTGALVGLTNRFRSAIAMAGFYNLTSKYGQFDVRRRLDVERNGLDLSAVSLMETSQGGMGGPPWADPERYLRNSPLMHVADVRTPIMLMTGDRDYVSTAQTEEFFTALARLDRDALMVRYYGEDHVYNSPANIRDMWRRIFDWYGQTLGPPMAVRP